MNQLERKGLLSLPSNNKEEQLLLLNKTCSSGASEWSTHGAHNHYFTGDAKFCKTAFGWKEAALGHLLNY